MTDRSEIELFFRLSEDKLRRRALWGGAALSLSLLMPYEILDDQPQFLWQLFGELPASGIVAAVAKALAGVVIIAARHLVRDAVGFAITVLAAMFGAFICSKLGTDASAWGLLPLPESLSARATLALIAMAGTVAGTSIAYRKHARRASKILIVGSVVVALLFYSWPGRGRAPASMILERLTLIGDLPGFRFVLGTLTLGVVAMWPALITSAGLLYVRRPPRSATSALPIVALFGFPLILVMLLFAWFARANPGSALFAAMGAALEITAVLALLSGALEVMGEGVLSEGGSHEGHRAFARGAGGALIALTLGMWWLARPPDKGVRWVLGPRSDAADVLFSERVRAWSRARWRWDAQVRGEDGSGARALVQMREEGQTLVNAAGEVDVRVAEAMQSLVHTGERANVSSRAWYRAVGDVNAASRDAGLPYYLDPEVRVRKTPEGLWRRFSAHTFVVSRARRFDVDGEAFSALHVHSVRQRSWEHRVGLLGYSRDVQPFALVVTEANAAHVQELIEMGRAERGEPRCGRVFSKDADRVLAHCGSLLSRLLERPELGEAVTAKVERHELQHQIDGPLLPLATSVQKKLAGYADTAQERVNRELSAYLAQLTSSVSPVHVGLVIPLRFALMQHRGTYHHASVLMFEALGGRRVRDAHGRVEPTKLEPVFDELSTMDEPALRHRAAEAWERLFGDELPSVSLVDESMSTE